MRIRSKLSIWSNEIKHSQKQWRERRLNGERRKKFAKLRINYSVEQIHKIKCNKMNIEPFKRARARGKQRSEVKDGKDGKGKSKQKRRAWLVEKEL